MNFKLKAHGNAIRGLYCVYAFMKSLWFITPAATLPSPGVPEKGSKAKWLGLIVLGLILGCQPCHRPPATTQPVVPGAGITGPTYVAEVSADCFPPEGWKIKPVAESLLHSHRVWVSPTGDTAYGVICLRLPLPFDQNLVLWQFVEGMKQSEKTGQLISKREDSQFGGLRFIADGGIYRMFGTLAAHGFRAWVFYAGTIRDKAVNAAEFDIAVRARELTLNRAHLKGQ